MKKTFALLLLGLSLFYLCPLLAQAQAGSEKRITISFHEAKLSSALKQLDEAFGGIYKIMFVYDEVDSHKVTVDIRNALPLDALSQVLKNTPFVYTVKDRFISVSLRQKSSEQKRALTGTVTDEQGAPIVGATILLRGTTRGTTSNADGAYRIAVRNSDQSPVLLFSFITFPIFDTFRYNGLGGDLLYDIIIGRATQLDDLIKLVMVALTFAAGFVGGEVVPLLVTGGTFGFTVATIAGLPTPAFAVLGAVGMLAGGTNLPVVCFALGLELFGYNEPMLLFIATAIAYATSGKHSIYQHQRQVFYRQFR